MSARWVAFIVWAVVAASVAFWGLRVFVSSRGLPPGTQIVGAAESPRGDVARLLGRPDAAEPTAVSVPAPSRFKLIGVITPRRAGDVAVALALISVDDKPAKAYRVGAVLDGDTLLREVKLRGASIGPRDGPTTTLELPPLAAARATPLPPIGAAFAQPMAAPTTPSFVRPMAPLRVTPPEPVPVPGSRVDGEPDDQVDAAGGEGQPMAAPPPQGPEPGLSE